jgi:ABC-2 type transport system permease protein
MRNAAIVARREFGSYVVSPIFWVMAAAFLFFFGLVFYIYSTQSQVAGVSPPQAEMRPLLGLLGTILLFAAPLLSMKLLSEEQRSGTLEVLMTSPVSDWQVVTGKWLAAFVVFAIMIALTFFHVLIMWQLAPNGIDPGPMMAAYLGILLLGAALLALGVLTSALTENQIIAGFLGIMLIMVLWFLPLVGEIGGSDSPVLAGLAQLGLSDHYANFGRGVIDSRDLLYFVTLTVGALYIATRILESRRWR